MPQNKPADIKGFKILKQPTPSFITKHHSPPNTIILSSLFSEHHSTANLIIFQQISSFSNSKHHYYELIYFTVHWTSTNSSPASIALHSPTNIFSLFHHFHSPSNIITLQQMSFSTSQHNSPSNVIILHHF